MNATRPLHIVHTTGAVNFLTPHAGDRRFFALQPAPLHEFRIRVPGHAPYHGLFPTAAAAHQQAERAFPDAPPASVVCTSRKRGGAR